MGASFIHILIAICFFSFGSANILMLSKPNDLIKPNSTSVLEDELNELNKIMKLTPLAHLNEMNNYTIFNLTNTSPVNISPGKKNTNTSFLEKQEERVTFYSIITPIIFIGFTLYVILYFFAIRFGPAFN